MNPLPSLPTWRLNILVVAAALTLPRCALDRSGTLALPGPDTVALDASVAPTLVCRGDAVTTAWNLRATTRPYCPYDDPGCLITIAVRLEPEALFSVSPGELNGSRTVNVNEDTDVAVIGEGIIRRSGTPPPPETRVEWQRFARNVEVATRRETRPAVAEGFCEGTAARFHRVTYPPHETTSERVGVTQLCNRSPYPRVNLTVDYFGSPDRPVTLGQGTEACAAIPSPLLPFPEDYIVGIDAYPEPLLQPGCQVLDPLTGVFADEPDDIRMEATVNCRGGRR